MKAVFPKSLYRAVMALGLLASASVAQANLLVNGNFDAGLQGVNTDYSLSNVGCISCVGVASNTLTWYNAPGYVLPFGDHTSGTGMMLLYDPPANPPTKRIWYQNVDVVSGQTYEFSGWMREANTENYGSEANNGLIGAYANNTSLGAFRASNPEDGWRFFSATYLADITGTIELALRDMNTTTWYGTYTAIDDLSFARTGATNNVPAPALGALMMLGLGLIALTPRRST